MGHLVRTLTYASNFVASHLVHFYQLAALDFLDPLAAGLDKPPFSPRYGPAYAPTTMPYDYYYRIPANITTYLVAQYVLALKFRRLCNQIGAIWGGRAPFVQGLTPGGMSTSISQASIDKTRELLFEGGVGGTPGSPAPGTILAFIGQPTDFPNWVALEGANQAKLPIVGDGSSLYAGTMMFDVFAAAMFYPEYFWFGNAYERFLAYGVLERGDEANPIGDKRLLSRGRKITGQKYPGSPNPLPAVQNNVFENVYSSYYVDPNAKWRHPWLGRTEPQPGHGAPAYTWVKSPRYRDASDPDYGADTYVPYEAGPLARMQVNGDYYAGVLRDVYLSVVGNDLIPVGPFAGASLPQYSNPGPDMSIPFGVGYPDLGPAGYNLSYIGDSALDRYAARQLEAWKIAQAMVGWLNRLQANVGGVTSKTRPIPGTSPPDTLTYKGYGWTEAPRGALGHWIKIKGGKIKKYQCVVPSTWNASPKDVNGNPGPAEKAMEDIFVKDTNHPLEVLRVSHSWDFCTACAVHLVTKKNGKKEEKVFKMNPTYL